MVELNNKRILYFPIVSMRSYETGEYDLACDGNVNRFLAFFKQVSSELLTIVLPKNSKPEGLQFINDMLDTGSGESVEIRTISNYPENAGSNRNDIGRVLYNAYLDITEGTSYDVVIYESELLGLQIEETKDESFETIFWCPVSSVGNPYFPEFLQDYVDIDIKLARSCNELIVATREQYEYFSKYRYDRTGIHIFNNTFDPETIEFDIDEDIIKTTDEAAKNGIAVYFPFRISDAGYRFDDVYNALKFEKDSFGINYTLFISDPNDSFKKKYGEDKNVVKVSSRRSTYYTLLKYGKVVVPYLETPSIFHASENELSYFKPQMIVAHKWTRSFNNQSVIICKSPDKMAYLGKSLEDAHTKITTKKDLFVIEGFDRTGKDTYLKYKNEMTEGVLFTKLHGPIPSYRNEKEAFLKCINSLIATQVDDIIDLYKKDVKDIIMTRLFMSDNVYSELFKRDDKVAEKYRPAVERWCNVHNIILLFPTYEEYLDRLRKIGDDVENPEYSEEEFYKIKDLYIKNKKPGDIVIYIEGKAGFEINEKIDNFINHTSKGIDLYQK